MVIIICHHSTIFAPDEARDFSSKSRAKTFWLRRDTDRTGVQFRHRDIPGLGIGPQRRQKCPSCPKIQNPDSDNLWFPHENENVWAICSGYHHLWTQICQNSEVDVQATWISKLIYSQEFEQKGHSLSLWSPNKRHPFEMMLTNCRFIIHHFGVQAISHNSGIQCTFPFRSYNAPKILAEIVDPWFDQLAHASYQIYTTETPHPIWWTGLRIEKLITANHPKPDNQLGFGHLHCSTLGTLQSPRSLLSYRCYSRTHGLHHVPCQNQGRGGIARCVNNENPEVDMSCQHSNNVPIVVSQTQAASPFTISLRS